MLGVAASAVAYGGGLRGCGHLVNLLCVAAALWLAAVHYSTPGGGVPTPLARVLQEALVFRVAVVAATLVHEVLREAASLLLPVGTS
jgi:hypothetical protein